MAPSAFFELEFSGAADGAIIRASTTAKLYATLGHMLDGGILSGIDHYVRDF